MVHTCRFGVQGAICQRVVLDFAGMYLTALVQYRYEAGFKAFFRETRGKFRV